MTPLLLAILICMQVTAQVIDVDLHVGDIRVTGTLSIRQEKRFDPRRMTGPSSAPLYLWRNPCGHWFPPSLEGDLDADGDVDLRDFAEWQLILGSEPIAPGQWVRWDYRR